MPDRISDIDLEIVRRLSGLSENPPPVPPEIAYLLIRDGLTGSYNRVYFDQRLDLELTRCTSDAPLAVFMIDMNRLKEINDQYGHQIGDASIQEVARAVHAITPPSGADCRVGGDEFAVLIPAVSADEAAWLQVAFEQEVNRRRVAVGRGRPSVQLSASVGLALAPADGVDAAGLFARADQRMYLSKRGVSSAPTAIGQPARGQPPLVGRQDDLDRLMAAVRRAGAGRGGLMVLRGLAGLGKTRLLQEAATRARTMGFQLQEISLGGTVGVGHLHHLVAVVIRAAGSGWARRLARQNPAVRQLFAVVFPSAGRGVEPPTYGEMAGAIREILAAVASRRPLLILIDDLHQAEPSVQAVLARLAPGLGELRVLILGAARRAPADPVSDPQPDWLTELSDRQEENVVPLSLVAAIELAEWAVGRALPAKVLERLPAVRDGNPLLILRLAAAGLLANTESPLDLAHAYEAHLYMLSEQAQAVLYAAAVLGAKGRTQQLAAVAPETPEALTAALSELADAGWLLRVGERWQFTHPVAWETAYARIPAMLRRTLHRVAAGALATEPDAAPAQLARHCDLSGDWAGAELYYRQAGAEAEVAFAYSEAAQFHRRCLEIGLQTGAAPGVLAETGLKAGQLYGQCDDFTAAAKMLETALQHCQEESGQGTILLRLAHAYYHTGQYAQFQDHLRQSVAFLRRTGPDRELAENLTYLIRVEVLAGNLATVRAMGAEVLAVASSLADPGQAFLWLAGAGNRLYEGGYVDLAQACWGVAEQRLVQVQGAPASLMARGLIDLALLRLNLGKVTGALAMIRRAVVHAEASGEPYLILNAGLQEVTWLTEFGFSAPARERLQHLEPLVQRSNSGFQQCWWLATAARACLFRHDLTGAERYATLFGRLSARLVPDYVPDGAALLARTRLARGERPDPAAWDPAVLLADRQQSALASAQLLTGAEVQLANGNANAATALVAAARARLVDLPEASWLDWVEGRVLSAQGDVTAALRAWHRAVRGQKLGYYQARAHQDLAELYLTAPHVPGVPAANRQARILLHIHRARKLYHRLENEHGLLQLRALELATASGTASDQGRRSTR